MAPKHPADLQPGRVRAEVRSIVGNICGYYVVQTHELIEALVEKVARTAKKPVGALLLTLGDEILNPVNTVGSYELDDASDLRIVAISPEEWKGTVAKSLDACPADAGRWVPAEKPYLDHDIPWPSHSAWLVGGAMVVQEHLQSGKAAAKWDPAYRESFADLLLRCLEVPTSENGDPWSYRAYLDYHYVAEGIFALADLYPDNLMKTAASYLPQVCKPGDPRVVQVVTKWMQRKTFSHGTLEEILRIAPCMLADIDRTVRRGVLRGQLEICSWFLRLWHFDGGMRSTRTELAQMLDWEISARYWAIVGLWVEEDSGMVLSFFNERKTKWSLFFGAHPELNWHL